MSIQFIFNSVLDTLSSLFSNFMDSSRNFGELIVNFNLEFFELFYAPKKESTCITCNILYIYQNVTLCYDFKLYSILCMTRKNHMTSADNLKHSQYKRERQSRSL